MMHLLIVNLENQVQNATKQASMLFGKVNEPGSNGFKNQSFGFWKNFWLPGFQGLG
jgi:hypothetical protein